MSKRVYFLQCAAWLLLFVSTATAQYRFDNWATDDGLPQNSVLSITQTRDGYLWATTFDGLVRFDGVHFTVFDKSNTKGIDSNRFVNLFEDRLSEKPISLSTFHLPLQKYSRRSKKILREKDLQTSSTPL